MMQYYGWGYGLGNFWAGPFGALFSLLIWILIIVAIVKLLRRHDGHDRFNRNSRFGPPQKTALDLLKERYAKGEINKQEFEEKKQDLL